MTGIAGTISREQAASRARLAPMAQALRVHPASLVESWSDEQAALCRVLNPAVDPGRQPIFGANRNRCMVFFGECFDYESEKRELIRRGHAFDEEASDAEYVLRVYEEYGDEGFRRLNGSFSCAIYDATDRSFRLVTDRLGSRPLFYGLAADGAFAFATRVSPLLTLSGISRELDAAAVVEFCTLQKVLGAKTYHRGVRMMPPASVLSFRDGEVRVSRFWTPAYRPVPGTVGQYAEELAETIKSATQSISRGPGRMGILVSGGLDARMMVAAVDGSPVCYCFGDYENPEYDAARQVAEARALDIRFLQRDPDHYPDMLDRAVELGSGMHPFNHAHALGFVERIAKHSTVLTHGYGIEALFRGTTLPKQRRSFRGISWSSRLDPTLTETSLPARYYRRAYSLLGRYPRLFVPGVAADLEARIEESARQTISEAEPHCATVYDKLLWSDVFARNRYTGYLFVLALRPYVVERSVLFDNRIIDLHLRMPVALRADDRLWLKAMARLNRRIAHVVNANTGHAADMPSWLLAGVRTAGALWKSIPAAGRLGKAGNVAMAQAPGFSPISWARFDWLIRHNEKLRAVIADTLSDPGALPGQVFDRKQAQAVLSEHLAGKGHHRDVLFALLTFGRWHRLRAAGA